MPERNIVILVGSGRSGTTWLGSILDTCEKADYFFEIEHYPELHVDSPELLRVKYPFTHWLKQSPVWIQRLEHKLLLELHNRKILVSATEKSLRIRNRFRCKKGRKTVNLFKTVKPFYIALDYARLSERYGNQIKFVHIIRNPFAQLASTSRMRASSSVKPGNAFHQAIDTIIENPRLSKYHQLARHYRNSSWAEKSALIWWIGNEIMTGNPDDNKTLVVFERLVKAPFDETERIFEFLNWPFSTETRNHIAETIDSDKANREQFSINKRADEVLDRWKENIPADDYERVSRLLQDCPLLELWNPDELQI